MATLRDLRKRLKAVKNTQKITKAMKMVAASKLRRAQLAIIQARPYALRMDEVLAHIVERTDIDSHPLLAYRIPKRVELVVLSANRGLCGGFNSTILRAAEQFIANNQAVYSHIGVATIGKKAKDHFLRRGTKLDASYDGLGDKPTYEAAANIAIDLSTRFRKGELDAVYLLYNEFKSAISQKLTVHQLLPIRPLDGWQDNSALVRIGELAAISGNVNAAPGRTTDLENIEGGDIEWEPSARLDVDDSGFEHVFEPNRADILDALLPQHLAVQIWRALLESTAAEHGARMSAMDAASRNAKDVIERLTLSTNRARQASITTELVEIVSGAAALAN